MTPRAARSRTAGGEGVAREAVLLLVPPWPTPRLQGRSAAMRLAVAPAGRRPACSTLARPITWPPETMASPSRRRGAGPRAHLPTAIKGNSFVSMDVGKGNTKARMVRGEAMLVPDLTHNLLLVRAIDRKGVAVVFVGDSCFILSDREAILASGLLSQAYVVGSGNEAENYVLKVTPVKASASAACTRMNGEAKLWHRRFNHLGFENLKRVAAMVDGIPSTVADAKRVPGTVCVPCVYGKMARSPHHRSTTTSTKCELLHTDVDGPLTESLGGSVYFMTLLEDSTGVITATPIKTKGMVLDVIKARIKQVRHDGAKEYVSNELKAWYDDKGITSEKTAPYSSQQNGTAERANRYIMERDRATLLDAGAEEELWAEALSSVIYVLYRSPRAGQDVTPVEALTGRRPDVKGFLVCGSRAWALKPKHQQRKLEPRTNVGGFVGYTVGGKAYRILDDESHKVLERRDMLMEETSSKPIDQTSPSGTACSPCLTAQTDGDKGDGAMDLLDAEGRSGYKFEPMPSSESDDEQEKEVSSGEEDDDDNAVGDAAAKQESSQELLSSLAGDGDDGAEAPRLSRRKPAPRVTWWESNPKAYLVARPAAGTIPDLDLSKPPSNAKEARARADWPLWKEAEKEEYLANKKLGTWSETKANNKRQAVKTRFVYDIKHNAEGNVTRYKARLAAQGFNQVPGRDFDETWAPVPNAATTRVLFFVAADNDCKVHHVYVKQPSSTPRWTRRCASSSQTARPRRRLDRPTVSTLSSMGLSRRGGCGKNKLDKELNDMGAARSKVDPCLYKWCHPVHGIVYILVYVDDLIVAAKSLAGVKAAKAFVATKFDVRDMDEVKDFIGMKVMRDRAAKVITLSNPGHLMALLEAFGIENSTPIKTPMLSGVTLSRMGEHLLPEVNRYAVLVNSVLYL